MMIGIPTRPDFQKVAVSHRGGLALTDGIQAPGKTGQRTGVGGIDGQCAFISGDGSAVATVCSEQVSKLGVVPLHSRFECNRAFE